SGQGLPGVRYRGAARDATRASCSSDDRRSRSARARAGRRAVAWLRDDARRARAGALGGGRARRRRRWRHRRDQHLRPGDAAARRALGRARTPARRRNTVDFDPPGNQRRETRCRMTHEEILQGLYDHTLVGNAPEVRALTEQGLEDDLDPEKMLYEALIPSLEEVGARFERGDFFVPEMLIAARAMQGALDLLRPLLAETGAKPIGTFVMGTVKGDVHDIGKNLVNIMLEGAGFTVHDLGVNVAPEKFV